MERQGSKRSAHFYVLQGDTVSIPESVEQRDDLWIQSKPQTYISDETQLGKDVVIRAGVFLMGNTTIGDKCEIGPNVIIRDSIIGARCKVESSHISKSEIGDEVTMGSYATIRPGCKIGNRVQIGSSAEMKNATFGDDVQVKHFSYLGDCEIGEGTIIEAGVVTCNYDGNDKHRTTIGKNAFIGANTMLIAPKTLGDNVRTEAGSIVTKDIPDNTTVAGSPARPIKQQKQQ